ncbi:MAG TPA: LacI family DNA-binding transcriptional regulator [Fimbriimonadaceae bacterium]|jgi:DNA-binding LacI/PurR family transcriptional regulator
MAVTLRDVAAKAGVSPVVVSRVLHNKAISIRVSESTAERVRQAAIDLDYKVNVWARNFRSQQTMMIGILHGIGFGRPLFNAGSRYFSALMDGIVEGAFRHGYSITLCPRLLSRSPEDAMTDGRFDGLVWYSSIPSEENLEMLKNCSVPLVLIHSHSEELNNRYPTVICDNDQGIGLAIEHLVKLGHTRIAFATEEKNATTESFARLIAFHKHMSRLGLQSGDEDIIEVELNEDVVDNYLASNLPHTAIVANNDGVASHFINRAPDHSVRIPEDLSIVGFDSTSFCDELRPGLTSVSQPLFSMGESAIDQLVSLIADDWSGPSEVVFPCGLDIRGSTKSNKLS